MKPLQDMQVARPRCRRGGLLVDRAPFLYCPHDSVQVPTASEVVGSSLIHGGSGAQSPLQEGDGAQVPGQAGESSDGGHRAGRAGASVRSCPSHQPPVTALGGKVADLLVPGTARVNGDLQEVQPVEPGRRDAHRRVPHEAAGEAVPELVRRGGRRQAAQEVAPEAGHAGHGEVVVVGDEI